MAILIHGILGGFTGKLGCVVGSYQNGNYIIRRAPGRRKNKPSEPQMKQQAKFSLIFKFLRPLAPLLNQTFRKSATQMSGFNKAFSYNIRHAIIGDNTDYKIDYNRVVLSRGNLPNVDTPRIESVIAGKLSLTWADNSRKNTASSIDKVFIAVYCESLNQWICSEDDATRNIGRQSFDVFDFSGKKVQAYVGLISANGKNASESRYMGAVNIV